MDFNTQFNEAIRLCKAEKYSESLSIIENLINDSYDYKKLYYFLLCISSKAKDDKRLFYYLFYFTQHNIWLDPELLLKSNCLQDYIGTELFKYYIEYCTLCKQSYELI